MQRLFPCQHLVYIAPDRIDLTIMDNQPVGMRTHPAWHGIRRKPGMDHSNRGSIIRITQVSKEGSQLPDQEHSLVNNGPAGE